MSYEIFEDEKNVKTVLRKADMEFFKKALKALKFPRDIDLVIFCASLGLYRSKLKGMEQKERNPSLKKLTSITTFNNKRLFDFLIMTYLKVEKERMKEFEAYFYTGFIILKNWFDKNDKNMNNTIERFCTIYDDYLEN